LSPEQTLNTAEMTETIQEYLRKDSQNWPVRSNRASEIGHPCERYFVYTRVAWRYRAPPGPTLAIIFRDGKIHETDVLRLLEDSGFDLVSQQEGWSWDLHNISGRLDAMMRLPDGSTLPIEIKTCSPFVYDQVFCQADLLKDPDRFWLVKWYGQFQIYLLMTNRELGLIVLKNKAPAGKFPIRLVDVSLDLDYCEMLVQRAERANKIHDEYIKAEEAGADPELLADMLPERIPPNEGICGRCDFIELCLGERQWGPKLLQVDDEELAAMLARRHELYNAGKEYDKVHDTVRTALQNRDEGDFQAVIGDFHCIVKADKAGKRRVTIKPISDEN